MKLTVLFVPLFFLALSLQFLYAQNETADTLGGEKPKVLKTPDMLADDVEVPPEAQDTSAQTPAGEMKTFTAEFLYDFTRADDDSSLMANLKKGIANKLRKEIRPFIDSMITADDILKELLAMQNAINPSAGADTVAAAEQAMPADTASADSADTPEALALDDDTYLQIWQQLPEVEIIEHDWMGDQYWGKGQIAIDLLQVNEILWLALEPPAEAEALPDSIQVPDSLLAEEEKVLTPEELFDEAVTDYLEGNFKTARKKFTTVVVQDTALIEGHLYIALCDFGEAKQQNAKLREQYPERYDLSGFYETLLKLESAFGVDSTLSESELLREPYYEMAEYFYAAANINDTYYIYAYIDKASELMAKAAELGHTGADAWLENIEARDFDNNPYFAPNYRFERRPLSAPLTKEELFNSSSEEEK